MRRRECQRRECQGILFVGAVISLPAVATVKSISKRCRRRAPHTWTRLIYRHGWPGRLPGTFPERLLTLAGGPPELRPARQSDCKPQTELAHDRADERDKENPELAVALDPGPKPILFSQDRFLLRLCLGFDLRPLGFGLVVFTRSPPVAGLLRDPDCFIPSELGQHRLGLDTFLLLPLSLELNNHDS